MAMEDQIKKKKDAGDKEGLEEVRNEAHFNSEYGISEIAEKALADLAARSQLAQEVSPSELRRIQDGGSLEEVARRTKIVRDEIETARTQAEGALLGISNNSGMSDEQVASVIQQDQIARDLDGSITKWSQSPEGEVERERRAKQTKDARDALYERFMSGGRLTFQEKMELVSSFSGTEEERRIMSETLFGKK